MKTFNKEFTLTYNGKSIPIPGYSSGVQQATDILKKHPNAEVKLEITFNKQQAVQPTLF